MTEWAKAVLKCAARRCSAPATKLVLLSDRDADRPAGGLFKGGVLDV